MIRCDKKFRDKRSLRKHEQRIHGVKNLSCDVSNVKFKGTGQLEVRKRSLHENDSKKPKTFHLNSAQEIFHCTSCKIKCSSQASLELHELNCRTLNPRIHENLTQTSQSQVLHPMHLERPQATKTYSRIPNIEDASALRIFS